MKASIIICLLFSTFAACENKSKVISLTNPNYLEIVDSLEIVLDSATYPHSKHFYCLDTVLFIQNEGTLTISLYNISGQKIQILDFARFKNQHPKFSLDNAWLTSLDSIFVYVENNKFMYLFNRDMKLLDSIKMIEKDKYRNPQKLPYPYISTSQLPLYKKDNIYTIGCSLGEDLNIEDKNRFVLCKTNKSNRDFFVNYPTAYNNTNWGGIYYRMVYNCLIGDSIICISYPATSEVALFNTNKNTTIFKKLYPDIDDIISPYHQRKDLSSKDEIAEHYYGQYSFRGIINDKYRKLFYRFLLQPTDAKSLQTNHMGPQKKYLLVYDSNFNFLGYNDLGVNDSHFTYFVSEKGLYIQKIKNKKDEDHIYFDIYNLRRKSY